jgi:hypothetical protein
MKAILGLLIFTSGLMGFLNAKEEHQFSSEKTYIDPNQVVFIEGAICVHIEDLWVQTAAVHADNNGFYIDSFQPIDEGYYSWRCSYCQKRNENYHRYCQKCGRERS